MSAKVSRLTGRRVIRLLVTTALPVAMLVTFSTQTAAANGGPANPNCWGVVTSQRATTEHDIGQHASSQDEPRLGLANVARLLYELGLTDGPHVSDLGSFLAEMDGLDATHCP